jgi:hypothetical protein
LKAVARSNGLNERFDIYISAVVILMFLAGCFLVVVSARERIRELRRWQSSAAAKAVPPAESELLPRTSEAKVDV